jgi:hypothetical protein
MAEIQSREGLPLISEWPAWDSKNRRDNNVVNRLGTLGYETTKDASFYLDAGKSIPGLSRRYQTIVKKAYKQLKEFERDCGGLENNSIGLTIDRVLKKYIN